MNSSTLLVNRRVCVVKWDSLSQVRTLDVRVTCHKVGRAFDEHAF